MWEFWLFWRLPSNFLFCLDWLTWGSCWGSLLWPINKAWQAPCATIKGLKQVLQVMERDWSELEAHDNVKPNIQNTRTHTHSKLPCVMSSWDWTEFSPTRLLLIKEEMSAHNECIINQLLPSPPCPTLTHHQQAQRSISVYYTYKNPTLCTKSH